jgi:chaperonin GroES
MKPTRGKFFFEKMDYNDVVDMNIYLQNDYRNWNFAKIKAIGIPEEGQEVDTAKLSEGDIVCIGVNTGRKINVLDHKDNTLVGHVCDIYMKWPNEPLGDIILLEKIEEEQIIIHDKEIKKAKVVAAGPGYIEKGNLIPLEVSKGDVVLYHSLIGTDMENGKNTEFIARPDDIIAIIE